MGIIHSISRMTLPKGYVEKEQKKQHQLSIVQQLRETASEKIADIDYDRQIERWNRYQKLLNGVRTKIGEKRGVTLKKNVKVNFHDRDEITERVLIITIIAGIVIVSTVPVALYEQNWIAFGVQLSMIGYAGYWYFLRLVYKPNTYKFTCKPAIHIDEMQYIESRVSGLPEPPKADPKIKLPSITMKIPRKWVGQRCMLEVMDGVADLSMDEIFDLR